MRYLVFAFPHRERKGNVNPSHSCLGSSQTFGVRISTLVQLPSPSPPPRAPISGRCAGVVLSPETCSFHSNRGLHKEERFGGKKMYCAASRLDQANGLFWFGCLTRSPKVLVLIPNVLSPPICIYMFTVYIFGQDV